MLKKIAWSGFISALIATSGHAQISLSDIRKKLTEEGQSEQSSEVSTLSISDIKNIYLDPKPPASLTTDESEFLSITKDYELSKAAWGAAIGALAGCIVAQNNGADCETGSLIGGAGGALVGKGIGALGASFQRERIKSRIELDQFYADCKVSIGKTEASLKATQSITEATEALAALLKGQAERGEITQQELNQKFSERYAFAEKLRALTEALEKDVAKLQRIEETAIRNSDGFSTPDDALQAKAYRAQLEHVVFQHNEHIDRFDAAAKWANSGLNASGG